MSAAGRPLVSDRVGAGERRVGAATERPATVTAMAVAPVNGIEIWYESIGDDADPPLLLVQGLGEQAIGWDDEFCEGFVDRGFRVIRFDNRDVGLSARVPGDVDVAEEVGRFLTGETPRPAYALEDMADDTAGLLRHLGIDAAHVVGTSMGGMIAQLVAINHGDLVRSLTSLMSNTGEAEYGQPHPEALALFAQPVADTRDGVIENAIKAAQVIGSPDHIDEDRVRHRAAARYDRAFDPDGFYRQAIAVLSAHSRAAQLAALATPTLVIHGTADKLVDPSGGKRTAELVPGASLELVEGMGHDLPVFFWSRVIELVTRHAAAASGTG